jgi:transcription-repair coupling factor (superfamily II helicase)
LEADHFGLSQLYQIRGRVGRSDTIAYAYLMYNPAKVLTETAVKRLESIKEFTELGSGYKIAMRDLSIRGAGDLLGKEQAGFIDAVGLDLYTRMVNDEIKRLQGETVEEESDTNNAAILNINTHIKDEYVSDESIKIEIHKLINSIKTKSDLNKIKAELEDRFGKISPEMEIYMYEKCAEEFINKMNVRHMQTSTQLSLIFPEDISNKVDGEKLFLEVYNINPKFQMSYRNKEITISLRTDNLPKNYIYYVFDLLNVINNQVKCV